MSFRKDAVLGGVGRPWEVGFQAASHEQVPGHVVSPGLGHALRWAYLFRQGLANDSHELWVFRYFFKGKKKP